MAQAVDTSRSDRIYKEDQLRLQFDEETKHPNIAMETEPEYYTNTPLQSAQM